MEPPEDRSPEQPLRLRPAAVALLSETFPETTLPDGRNVRALLSSLGWEVYLANDGTLLVDMYFDEPDFQSSIREATDKETWQALRILGSRLGLSALLSELPSAPDEDCHCSLCRSTGWHHIEGIQVDLVCFACHGLGWS